MSDTRLNITPGWGPGHRDWPSSWGRMSTKMQAREKNSVGRRHRHRFRSIGGTPMHILVKRDEQRCLKEAMGDD